MLQTNVFSLWKRKQVICHKTVPWLKRLIKTSHKYENNIYANATLNGNAIRCTFDSSIWHYVPSRTVSKILAHAAYFLMTTTPCRKCINIVVMYVHEYDITDGIKVNDLGHPVLIYVNRWPRIQTVHYSVKKSLTLEITAYLWAFWYALVSSFNEKLTLISLHKIMALSNWTNLELDNTTSSTVTQSWCRSSLTCNEIPIASSIYYIEQIEKMVQSQHLPDHHKGSLQPR